MPRERWFFAEASGRRGPVPLAQLVEALLRQEDARAVLVWRKGQAGWTRAEDVPDVARRLVPLLAAPVLPKAIRPPALAYAALAACALGLLGWLSWPRHPVPTPVPLGASTVESAPAIVIPRAPSAAASPHEPPAPPEPPSGHPSVAAAPAPKASHVAVADRERELPASERRRLRGVAAWSAGRLELTVHNVTAWRLTELRVKVFRFAGDDFVEDAQPVTLLPPAMPVDAGVVDLMNQVAPERRRPGLNPLDTGPFEGQAGLPPESFRFEIASARGYPPRR